MLVRAGLSGDLAQNGAHKNHRGRACSVIRGLDTQLKTSFLSALPRLARHTFVTEG